MPRSKKARPRNLNPCSFEATPATWNKSQKNEITKIRKKYDIPSSFAFADYLAELPIHAESFKEGIKQIPTTKEKHQYVDAIYQKTSELINLLYSSGSLILTQIARNTDDTYKTITQLRNELLPRLLSGCEITMQQLPPIKGGRPRDSFKFAIIHHVVNIYTLATGKEPTCGYDDIVQTHVGDCYNFIVDLNKLILPSLGLSFDKESTVGQYLHESLQYRSTQIMNGYAKLQSHLLGSPPSTNGQIMHVIASMEHAFLILKAHPHIT